MNKTLNLFLLTTALAVKAVAQVEYVNPMIGTDGMGHTFPGACVPFGIVQLSPDTDTIPHNVDGKYQPQTYAYCAGYQYKDKTIVGFSHTHMSGTGHSDLGDILIMPTTGKLFLNPGTADNPDAGYRSRFSHQTEKSVPGHYQVTLDDYKVKAELTATPRVGVHKYTFPQNEDGRIVVDLNHGIYNYDGKTLWAMMRVENDTLVTGYRITNGWARTNYTYFAMSFSQPVKNFGYKDHERILYNGWWRKFPVNNNFPEMAGRKLVSYFEFDTKSNPELVVKVALSATGTDGAVRNLMREAAGKDFATIAREASDNWNSQLSSIQVEGTEDQKAMFYTSYYHTMINPSVYMDVDGRYRGLDQNIHRARGFKNYTIFSLWDTYRAEHPFLMLMKPRAARDMAMSMIRHQQQSVHGLLPIWSHMANDNWCMSGYHATSVLADAIAKGAQINPAEALKAMEKTSKVPYLEGLGEYNQLGYVPLEASGTAASTTLEYCYDDWTIYQTALNSGNERLAQEYLQRALNYRKIYDPEIGFARPRFRNGDFKPQFDVLQTHGEGFIEGNSFNFSFHVPHDVLGVMKLMGGEKEFLRKLDELFGMHLPKKYYEANEDITEDCLIGGYVHGNEPSHHIPYLYAWTSQPWKTQYWVREVMNKMYRNHIRGLGGNDDCGQMSAWYLFTAMGFYPVCPGTDQYVLGAPYLPYLKLTLEGGKTFEIKAPGVSDTNRYVKSVRLNGKPYTKTYITHADLVKGGTLEFQMSDKPNKKRGKDKADKPYSLTDGENVITPEPKAEDNEAEAKWANYYLGNILFEDQAKGTEGSRIYHSIIPNPEQYISKQARTVLNTLYFSPKDSIVPVNNLHYTLQDIDGISAKGGGNGEIGIFYSTRHIAKSFKDNDTAKVDFESRGVLLHELTHAYQLEPQGIGSYGTNKVFWAFIEGMADAVRVANGGFNGEEDRPKGGHYMNGYRFAGYFFVWLRDNKDPDFLRKFNRSTLEVVPWSFDGAIKHVLGKEYDIEELWKEYQKAVGDI